MNTFILMWNPAVSSFSWRDFKDSFRAPLWETYNWSVWDWSKAHAGDRFFMVRVGEEGLHGKGNGIVMSGFFISEPYRGEDWSGKGREVYYMDLQPDYLFDTGKVTTLTDDFLAEAIPGFDWTGGHSGRILEPDMAKHLEECWEKVLEESRNILENGHRWATARDVFRHAKAVNLFVEHFRNAVRYDYAEFSGGWLYLSSFYYVYDHILEEYLPELPDDAPVDDSDEYSLDVTALMTAFGARDEREVAAILRRDYSGPEGMRRLLDFAREAGCEIERNDFLAD